jgi:protein-S-isoprenylcysteine O-methyltransferase Ste14
MRATDWEFRYRAMIFGLIIGLAFPLYLIDHQNSTAALANFVAPRLHVDAAARVIFTLAALLLCIAAFIRTWASSFLHAEVVYASAVKTEALVADGPYRYLRNPLYLANVLMAVAMGTLMSRLGSVVAVLAMLLFCYRLIRREEAELAATQGEQYQRYVKAVPRLWPSLRPRIAAAGNKPRWREGFKAEGWYWGFALSLIAFACTLELQIFFIILSASMVLFWVSSSMLRKPRRTLKS